VNRVVERTGARFVGSADSPVHADFEQVIVDARGRLYRRGCPR
jgi:hypothetical protein